jgi:hypothetical protein
MVDSPDHACQLVLVTKLTAVFQDRPGLSHPDALLLSGKTRI